MSLLTELSGVAPYGTGNPIWYQDPQNIFVFQVQGNWIPLRIQDLSNQASFVEMTRDLVLTVHMRAVQNGTPVAQAVRDGDSRFATLKGFVAWKEILPAPHSLVQVERTIYMRHDLDTMVEEVQTCAGIVHGIFGTLHLTLLVRGNQGKELAIEQCLRELVSTLRPAQPAPMARPYVQPPPSQQPMMPAYAQSASQQPMMPYYGQPMPQPPMGMPYPPPSQQSGYVLPPQQAQQPVQPPLQQIQPPQQPMQQQVQPQPTQPAYHDWPVVAFPALSLSLSVPIEWQSEQVARDVIELRSARGGLLLLLASLLETESEWLQETERVLTDAGILLQSTEGFVRVGDRASATLQCQDAQGQTLRARVSGRQGQEGNTLLVVALGDNAMQQLLSIEPSMKAGRIAQDLATTQSLLGGWQPQGEGSSYRFQADGRYQYGAETGRFVVSHRSLITSGRQTRRFLMCKLENGQLLLNREVFQRLL